MSNEITPPEFDANPDADVSLPVVDPEPLPQLPSEERLAESIAVQIDLELDHYQAGFVCRSLDDPRIAGTRITHEQAIALKLLSCSLNKQAQRMNNERFVQTQPDALRYLLDQIVSQIPDEVMAQLKAA